MQNLNIVCKDFELTDAVHDYLSAKLEMLYKYLTHKEELISFHARLGKIANQQHGKIFYAEVSIHSPDKNFGARLEADTLYAAIDLLKDELAHNITQYKKKHLTVARKEEAKFKQEIRQIPEE